MSLARVVYKGDTNVPMDYIKNTKWRKSCVYEPKNFVRNYMLNQARFTVETETPAHESDLARDYKMTESRINLRRYGRPYDKYPDHSEANFSLTEKDPRGFQELPDMGRLRDRFEHSAAKYEYQFGTDGVENYVERGRDGIRLQADKQEMRARFKRGFVNFSYGKAGMIQGGLSKRRDGTYTHIDMTKGMRQLGEAMDDNTKQKLKSSPFKYAAPNSEAQIGYYSINDARLPVAEYSQTPTSGRQFLLAKYSEAKADHKAKENKESKNMKKSLVLTMNNYLNQKNVTSYQAKEHMLLKIKEQKANTNVTTGRYDKAADNLRQATTANHKIKNHKNTIIRNMRLDTNLREAMENYEEDRRVPKKRSKETLDYSTAKLQQTQDLIKVRGDLKQKRGKATTFRPGARSALDTDYLDYAYIEHDRDDNKGRIAGMARPTNLHQGSKSNQDYKPGFGSYATGQGGRKHSSSRTLGIRANQSDHIGAAMNER